MTNAEIRDLLARAIAHGEAGRTETAVNHAEVAEHLFEEQPEPHHSAALVTEALGQFDEALGQFDEDEPEAALDTLRVAVAEMAE